MNIIKTYSGKIGCMCGCLGKYNYTAYGADKHYPGYTVDVNERGAKIIASKVKKDSRAVEMDLGDQVTCLYVEDRVNNSMKAVFYTK